jgi:hypothetical protein
VELVLALAYLVLAMDLVVVFRLRAKVKALEKDLAVALVRESEWLQAPLEE